MKTHRCRSSKFLVEVSQVCVLDVKSRGSMRSDISWNIRGLELGAGSGRGCVARTETGD
jgi:hypothetical protein